MFFHQAEERGTASHQLPDAGLENRKMIFSSSGISLSP